MQHKFVEFIPTEIEQDVLYISIEYDIAKHKCACGCGANIVTSLSPSRWKLTYDGETVSLSPSIGNWSHPCQSHYFITNDKIIWAGSISKTAIQEVIKNDQESVKKHVQKSNRLIDKIKRLFKH
ncbi:DUF6527 family protein [Margalitia sp. FSL K6-0131]|uniref:DUF6527 family protein n=1 Tax=Margalitia sp. FSL K6-0131 TaxID=2954604 RepID=UPI0030F5C47C